MLNGGYNPTNIRFVPSSQQHRPPPRVGLGIVSGLLLHRFVISRMSLCTIPWWWIYRHQLVGGFKHVFNFPFHIWDVILPIDFQSIIFQDGHIAPPPTVNLLPHNAGTALFMDTKKRVVASDLTRNCQGGEPGWRFRRLFFFRPWQHCRLLLVDSNIFQLFYQNNRNKLD